MDTFTTVFPLATPTERETLSQMEACVIGCGALGAQAALILARMGLGYMTLIDGGMYTAQHILSDICATTETLGQGKAQVLGSAVAAANPTMLLRVLPVNLVLQNAGDLLPNHDVILDCSGSLQVCELLSTQSQTPVIAVSATAVTGRIRIQRPGESGNDAPPCEDESAPSPFSAAILASLAGYEAIKLLIKQDALPSGTALQLDMNDYCLTRAPLQR